MIHKFTFYFINKFQKSLLNNLEKNIHIIYRNYEKKTNIDEIIEIRKLCKRSNRKIFLANDIRLAIRLNLDGVYIPSFNKNFNHLSYTYDKYFKIIGSAHNLKEIKIKELQRVEKIFISSLFKKNKNYLGINKFKYLSNLTKKKIVVLGGVSSKNIKQLNLLNNLEFAGISYFE